MSDFYLMKRVIILKRIQVTMKTSVPPFFNHLGLSLNRKKACGNESYEKETEYIRIGNLNCCKCGDCKNEARELDWLCCREIEVDAMLIISAKFPQCEGSISPTAFMGYCRTISHTS